MMNQIMSRIVGYTLTVCVLVTVWTGIAFGQTFPKGCFTGDLTIRFSPVRLLGSERFQKVLMSDEWTRFYLAATEKLDKDFLGSKQWASLARQLEKTYAQTPPHINSLFDTAFGNCHDLWLCCDLDVRSLLPRLADPAFMFVTDFSPVETKRLLVSTFEIWGYVPRMSQSESVFALSKGDILVWFVDSFGSLGENQTHQAFLVGKDPSKMNGFKDCFLKDIAERQGLNDGTAAFFSVRLSQVGLGHIREYFAGLPKEDPASVFAPGMIEVAKKTKEMSLSVEGIADRFVCVLKLSCSDEATAKDLALFVTKSKTLLEKWATEDRASPLGRLGVFLLTQAEVAIDRTALTIRYESTNEQGLKHIQECLVHWKKRLVQ